ncbi:hypothetical protein Tsubulata_040379 [Turnera subulata]|uniref:Uncharacterized protein n=1 Tax=Turnera subulata TaxID=218843 RepID=A0A9Q0FD13_9ROSI|nr:hypothetical protein Tsubulata_040379 [Turnera subulata]
MPRRLDDLFMQWVEFARRSSAKPSWMTIFYACIWSIWLVRNSKIFEGKVVDWERPFDVVLLWALAWIKVKQPNFPYSLGDLLVSAEGIRDWGGGKN